MSVRAHEGLGPAAAPADLAAIARRAMSLQERVAAAHATTADAGLAAPEALEPWVSAFSAGDRGAWSRRLSWDGWDEQIVRRALALDSGPVRGSASAWTDLLEAALRHAPDVAANLLSGKPLPESAWSPLSASAPFSEFWVPFARAAGKALAEQAEGAFAAAPPEVLAPLEERLLAQLTSAGELALYKRFSPFRDGRAPFAARWPLDSCDVPPRAIYSEFIGRLLSDPLPFFEEYSVLARQAARLIEGWVIASAEFFVRLRADRPLLEAEFGPLGALRALSPGLSDRHNAGRSVFGLTFDSGTKLIYKPRTVGLEFAYNGFLRWLAENSARPALPALRVVARDGYGWTEVVAQAPAGSREEVETYSRRAGMLLCVAYVLGGKDLHMDNVIATASSPVIIDSESILQPDLASDEEDAGPRSAMDRASRRVGRSFVRSGLLTFLRLDATGRVCDIGGLRGSGGYVATTSRRAWRFVNTDAMRLEYERAISEPMKNVLVFEGRPVKLEEFPEPMVDGFASMYRFLMEKCGEIAAETGPLALFRGEKTRVVFRPSNLYAAVLDELVTPRFQREGVLSSFRLDLLNRPFCREPSRPLLWPLVAEEQAALENLDIPYFLVGTETAVLSAVNGEEIRGYLARSGLAAAADRIRRLSEENLAEQVSLLRALLMTPREPWIEPGDRGEAWGGFATPFSRAMFLRQAEAIGAEIRGRAVEGDDGGLTWIAPNYLRLEERPDRGVSYYLYDGASGIALFFSALGAVTGKSEHFAAARAACRPIETVLASPQAGSMLVHEGIGGCNGLGSILYALSVAGRLSSEGGFLDLAERVASHLTLNRIASDRNLDVDGGAAGGILGLMALHGTRPSPDLLEKAIACGRLLLSRREAIPSGGWAWRGRDGALLAGFAHGAAGIALALARLYQATANEEFRRAAFQAHVYERGLFSQEARNWPVLPSGEQRRAKPVFMTAWCHGAPGIGLARAGSRAVLADGEVEAEIEAALATTLAAGLMRVDHLCCGNLGPAEVLLTLGRLLGRDELVGEARARAADVLARATEARTFRLRSSESENLCFQPGFFRGLSGVGYELLRMAEPDAIPSVLLFESAAVRP